MPPCPQAGLSTTLRCAGGWVRDKLMGRTSLDIDIALDPVPYNGGTTTLQALWMGVPVVVKEGAHFVSRMGASFMRALDLPDWVASDDDAYVATAVAKGRDRQALLQLKQALRQRQLDCPAWDVKQHTRAMEEALTTMAKTMPALSLPD